MFTNSFKDFNLKFPKLIRRFGGYRDAILSMLGISYALGFIIWSFNSWKNNLGLLPLLDPQYLSAGFIPLSIVVLIYFMFCCLDFVFDFFIKIISFISVIIKGLIELNDNYINNPSKIFEFSKKGGNPIQTSESDPDKTADIRETKLKKLPGLANIYQNQNISLLPNANNGIRTIVVLKQESFEEQFNKKYNNEKDIILKKQRSKLAKAKFLVAFLGLILVFIYTVTIFQDIPQEFGGINPRQAFLDVKESDLSNETLQSLFPVCTASKINDVRRSCKLDVFFKGPNYMIVKPVNAERNSAVYEIQLKNVQGITWCE